MSERRRLILHMSMSIDGFVGAPDGSMPWFVPPGGADHGARRFQANLEMLRDAGTLLIGRVAAEVMVNAWAPGESPIARRMNELEKVIFSETGAEVEWANARPNVRPLAEEVEALKGEPGGNIIAIGGGHFAHSLLRAGLIDEIRLTTHPFALGEGISFWHGLPEVRRFELVSNSTYTDGVVVQTLIPA